MSLAFRILRNCSTILFLSYSTSVCSHSIHHFQYSYESSSREFRFRAENLRDRRVRVSAQDVYSLSLRTLRVLVDLETPQARCYYTGSVEEDADLAVDVHWHSI